ncbi:MAG: PASTA domain-containing protein [Candidatus Zixiibacteriota bacterium]
MRRKLALKLGMPLLLLFLAALLVDQVVMPIITRQGTEFPLPDFTDQRLVEAEIKLEDMNLAYTVSAEEYAPTKERGLILKQFPVAGTKVKEGRIVKFVISKGTRMVKIPMVAGKSVRQAMLDLETEGLVLGEVSWAVSDTIPEKIVVFSYPAAGVEVPMGSAVNLMVNRGRATDYTFMPKLIGMPLDDARELLEEKGLKIGLISYKTNDNYLPETVLEQSEPEGTELTLGTEIDLVVSET